jgi:hypothetical protein
MSDDGKQSILPAGGLATALAIAKPKIEVIDAVPVNEIEEYIKVTDVQGTNSFKVRLDNKTEDWGPIQRAAVAKMNSKNSWSKEPFIAVLDAVMYADRTGLSFEEHDVYMIDGNLQVDSKARIKRGYATGLIKNVKILTESRRQKTIKSEKEGGADTFKFYWLQIDQESDDPVEIIKVPEKNKQGSFVWTIPHIRTTVTLTCTHLTDPQEYVADIAEWYKGSSDHWTKRPRYALEQNALGHAFDRIKPRGSDLDDSI